MTIPQYITQKNAKYTNPLQRKDFQVKAVKEGWTFSLLYI